MLPRCVNDIFGYCSTPMPESSIHLHHGRGQDGYTGLGSCPKDWRKCPSHQTFTASLPDLSVSNKK